MKHTLLMGDPRHFSVRGGANPHTRTRFGLKKTVDAQRAISQWHGLKSRLEGLGFRIVVIPADPAWPGSVYPANAGFRTGDQFVLSHLLPTRAGETPLYRKAVEALGLRCHEIEPRFEGEADLFPADIYLLFTYGVIQRQRFVPHWGIPPWRRIYGFRSELGALDAIDEIQPFGREILKLRLVHEAYYHGDTCLCSFGPARRYLLAYLPALDLPSQRRVREVFGPNLLELSEEDAAIYAANSFSFEMDDTPHLVMPAGISSQLLDAIRERDVTVHEADVSEFHKKGGGSVKCMLGDLGIIP